ncbi:Oidioi.mRNA.OKI2018_I69.chr2.g5179.t1.cds [Oikopleura dioica]|uniref:Oidioi.mRNA.OKI2018_I69.chr2.g5179.t1.cds n=1 Tax=Oikopleura dioica TaxID=34765 RepID=A0ABN7SZB6_OIKDI|nr:Oidioi.mRNA.OKI2018_I69.chr2.g5179.t1.cds [Oikopleura dioica]
MIKLARESSTSICLPPPSFCLDGKPSTCVVVSPDGQTETQIEPMEEERCNVRHGYNVNINGLYENCARSGSFSQKQGCSFAPGSPIMCRFPQDNTWVLYGIVNTVKECGVESASVYTKFKTVSSWVNQYQSIDSGLSEPNEDEICDYVTSRSSAGLKLPDNEDAKGWQKEGICGVPDVQPKAPPVEFSGRIIGGEHAVKNSWPWQTYIVSCQQDGCMTCGGTLISPYWVLTAGHCVPTGYGAQGYALFGAHKISEKKEHIDSIDIREFVIHPSYERRILKHDIALARLVKPAPMGDLSEVRPICLPDSSICLPEAQKCVAVGWGVTSENSDQSSDILMQVSVPLIPRSKCVKLPKPYNLVSPYAICAGFDEGGQDACTGDSGGPLLCQTGEESPWIVYGVTSWGYGCGRAGKPGVYTRVNLYNKWITSVTGITPSINDDDYPKVSCDDEKRERAFLATTTTTTTSTTTTTTTMKPTTEPPTEKPLPENPQDLSICSNPAFAPRTSLFNQLPAHRRRRQASLGANFFFNNYLPPTSSEKKKRKKQKNKKSPSAAFSELFAPQVEKATIPEFVEDPNFKRIVGGQVALKNSWPWTVYIKISNQKKSDYCGGTLIGNQWVLTAAHCIPKFSVNVTSEDGRSITKSPKLTLPNLEKRFDIKKRSREELKGVFKMKVFLGVHDSTDEGLANAESRDVVDIITHPEFNRPQDYNNDVALLKLETPVHFSDNISPLCLPDEKVCMKEGVPCVTVGWGITDEKNVTSTADELQEVVVRVISNEKCLTYPDYTDKVTEQMVCAGYKDGGKDACSGDSGGPLMCKVRENGPWVFYGITSFGIGCARPNAPGVYARVPQFVDWIKEMTQLEPGITTDAFPELSKDKQCGGWIDENFKPFDEAKEKSEFFDGVDGREAQECDVLETAPAKITSENHPKPYLPDTDCRYCVKSSQDGGFVQLEITDLRLDQKRNCYPNDDYIIVEDLAGKPISNPICRIIRRSPIKAMAEEAICIRMMSNEKVQRAGFKALFSEVNEFQSACGGNANSVAAVNDRYPRRKLSAERTIESANFPERVPPGSECSWHIEAPNKNQVVQINFSFFKLAKNCKFHFVALYSSPDCNKDNLTPENQIAVLCGLKKRKSVWEHFSQGQGLCVVMVTDKTSVSAGFQATYQAIAKSAVPVRETQGSRSNELGFSNTERVQIPESIGKKYWVIGN